MVKVSKVLMSMVLCLCACATFATLAAEQNPVLTLVSADNQKGVTFDAAQLNALPQVTLTEETPWYKVPQVFSGPLLRDVLKASGLKGSKLYVVALNDYAAEIPLADIDHYDVVLATKLNGEPMSIRDKGPLFVMYPFDKNSELKRKEIYDRCVWQVNKIRLE